MGGQISLHATSPDGKHQEEGLVPIHVDSGDVRLSPDGKWLFYQSGRIAYVFDMVKNIRVPGLEFTVPDDCDSQYDILPTIDLVVSACGVPGISVKSLKGGSPSAQIAEGSSLYPSWSPDGKWIAYFVFEGVPNPKLGQVELGPRDGLYLIDVSCLGDTAACPAKTRRIAAVPPQELSWSADGTHLAVGRGLYDLQRDKIYYPKALDKLGTLGHIVWSPDDTKIAVAAIGQAKDFSEAGIYLVSVKSGIATKIPNCECAGNTMAWIEVP